MPTTSLHTDEASVATATVIISRALDLATLGLSSLGLPTIHPDGCGLVDDIEIDFFSKLC